MLTAKLNFPLITTTHIKACDKQSKNNKAKQYMINRQYTDEKYESRKLQNSKLAHAIVVAWAIPSHFVCFVGLFMNFYES